MNKNIKIFFNYFFGSLLFIWLSYSIYDQVKNQPHLELSWNKIKSSLNGEQSWMFWVVLFLMMFNWGVEARKWQVLLKKIETMSWWRAFKATLTGVAFAINTPNRIGEYGGRILYVHEGNRIKAVSLTLVGNMSQILVTMISGCGGLIFLLSKAGAQKPLLNAGSYMFWIQVMFYVVSVLSIIGVLVYFKLGWLVRCFDKVPPFSKIANYMEVMEELSFSILLRVFSLSFIRYLVFTCQYILMIRLMQVEVTVWQAFWLISVIYLVLSIVPTIALAEIGIRGKVSMEIFGLFSINNIGILAASVGIWAINLAVPALLGSLLILRIKIFKNR
ncbi:MAG: lysylphosphatidylglycerol synthase transmembrane domain-containing protein [Chitinophagaceae bacterium]